MSKFCSKCGSQIKSESKFCTACGYSAQPSQDETMQDKRIKNSRIKKTTLITIGIVLLVPITFILAFFVRGYLSSGAKISPSMGISGDNSHTGIIVNDMIFEKEQTISAEGGVILVDNEDSLINGLEIDIAEGSLDQAGEFSISYGEIIGHGFDPELKLITPLIHVENNLGYTKDAMTVRVPCIVPQDAIPVAFYYHEDDKSLEYIPVVDFDSESVTIGLRHFSSGVLGYFTKSYIEEVEVIDTGFVPGVDDFSFKNIGSSITPRGNCFGESIAAIWYYNKLKASKGNLYGKYDNYTKNSSINFETKTFQHDDVLAYRLASMSQLLFVVSPETTQIDWGISRWNAMRTSDQLRFDQLLALMKFSGPQVVLIQRLDSNKITRNFHAIIAYKAVGNYIYVADPNNPGKKDRYIEIEDGTFKPYSSADNALSLATTSVDYNVFSAFGETAMFDYNKMAGLWEELELGTVGDEKFPEVDVKFIAAVENAQGEEEKKVMDDNFTLSSDNLTFLVETPSGVQRSVFYTDGVMEPVRLTPQAARYTIQVDKDKQNYIGVLLGKNSNWYGFEWFSIGLSDIAGTYDVTGSISSTVESVGIKRDLGDQEALTPFQAQVELSGSDMTISFLDTSKTVLQGTYDKATGVFRGMDYSEPEDIWSTTVWMMKEVMIKFDTEGETITAIGVTEVNDDPDPDAVTVDMMVEIEMIKVSDE